MGIEFETGIVFLSPLDDFMMGEGEIWFGMDFAIFMLHSGGGWIFFVLRVSVLQKKRVREGVCQFIDILVDVYAVTAKKNG